MTDAEILRQARALIEAPERWTKGRLARDENRREVDPDSTDATCWCASGAIYKATKIESAMPIDFLHLALEETHPKFFGIEEWNDDSDTTHADILAVYDRAIALAEATP